MCGGLPVAAPVAALLLPAQSSLWPHSVGRGIEEQVDCMGTIRDDDTDDRRRAADIYIKAT